MRNYFRVVFLLVVVVLCLELGVFFRRVGKFISVFIFSIVAIGLSFLFVRGRGKCFLGEKVIGFVVFIRCFCCCVVIGLAYVESSFFSFWIVFFRRVRVCGFG